MNYYELLEVSQNASKEVIRAAYKSLMQRYHPDKHPDNAEIANRAALLVQAYSVLSDTDKRNTYDLQIKIQSETRPSPLPERTSSRIVRKTYIREKIAKENKASWYPWLLISVILLSGIFILFSSKKQPYPPEDSPLPSIGRFSEKHNPANPERSDTPDEDEIAFAKGEKEIPGRTIPLFFKTMTVKLKPPEKSESDPEKPLEEAPERVLSIPTLLVKVGSFDSDKFTHYLDTRKEAINLQLAEKLANARHEELIKVDGERYLKKFILKALADITGTDKPEDSSTSASRSTMRYGVTDVILPESFSVK